MSNDVKIRKVQVDVKLSLGGRKFKITDVLDDGKSRIPLIDIPMMTDERWNEIARSQENQALLHPVNQMDDLIDEYQAQVNILNDMLVGYYKKLRTASRKRRHIEVGALHKKIDSVRSARDEMLYAIKEMKKYE